MRASITVAISAVILSEGSLLRSRVTTFFTPDWALSDAKLKMIRVADRRLTEFREI